MKFQVSVSKAIRKAEESAKKWRERESQGKAYGFSQRDERLARELRRFKSALKRNRSNPDYFCKDMSGYIDVLQNALFHTNFIVTDEKIKKRLHKIHDELAILFYLLDDIDIVP